MINNNSRDDFDRRGRFERDGGADGGVGNDYGSDRDRLPPRYTDERDFRDRPPFGGRGGRVNLDIGRGRGGRGRGSFENSGRGRNGPRDARYHNDRGGSDYSGRGGNRRDSPFRGMDDRDRRNSSFRGIGDRDRLDPSLRGMDEIDRRDSSFRGSEDNGSIRDNSRDRDRNIQRDRSRDSPRSINGITRDRNESMRDRDRDGPREFGRVEHRDIPRDFPRRDGPRELPREGSNFVPRDSARDNLRDQQPSRIGPREGRDIYSREDDRYHVSGKSALGSSSYSNILKEADLRKEENLELTPGDRFGKRRRDDGDFRLIEHDDKRPRSNDYGPRDSQINRTMPANNSKYDNNRNFGRRESESNINKPLYIDPVREEHLNELPLGGRPNAALNNEQPPQPRDYRGSHQRLEQQQDMRPGDEPVDRIGVDKKRVESVDKKRVERDFSGSESHQPISQGDPVNRDGDCSLEDPRSRFQGVGREYTNHTEDYDSSSKSKHITNNFQGRPDDCIQSTIPPATAMPSRNSSVVHGGETHYHSGSNTRYEDGGSGGGGGPSNNSGPSHPPAFSSFSDRSPFSDHPDRESISDYRGRGGRGRGGRGFRGRGRGRFDSGGRFGQRGRGRGVDYQRSFPPSNLEERGGGGRDRDPHFVHPYHHNSNRVSEGNNWTRRGEDGFTKSDSFASMAHNRDTRDRDREASSNFSPPPSNSQTGSSSNNNNNEQINDNVCNTHPARTEEKIVLLNFGVKTAKASGEVVDIEKGVEVDNDMKKKLQPLKVTPPPKGKPTGIMLALARLIELESSMEYAYTKHMLLVNRRRELQHQQKVLETLPVGLDAIEKDLEKPRPAGDLYD